MGLGALLFPSQAECFPKERGIRTGCVQLPWELETKEKQEKKLPCMYPPVKGIHSEKQREFFLNGVFLACEREPVKWILRSNDKRRVLGLWPFVGTFDINHEKGNGNHWKIPQKRLCWDNGGNGRDFFCSFSFRKEQHSFSLLRPKCSLWSSSPLPHIGLGKYLQSFSTMLRVSLSGH